MARPQNFAKRNDETELELSVESRSFVNRVNDQVRKRQKRVSNVAGDGEEHYMIWGMFMAVTCDLKGSETVRKKNRVSRMKSMKRPAAMFDKSSTNQRGFQCEIKG